MYDIIIIGAGPAGLTAALYARRAMKKVLVLEALTYGGKIINSSIVENYPVNPHISGYDFATKLYNQVKELDCEIKFEKVININNQKDYKEVITKYNTYKTKTIILAIGNENRKLGLSNEKELVGKGISYCATCDGSFFKNKDVAIVGGGDTAVEDALYLSNICKNIYIIHRKEELSADFENIKNLQEKNNIKIYYNSNIIKIHGKESLTSIEIKDNDDNTTVLNISGLFIAIGQVPETENFKKIVNTNQFGYIIAGEDCHTNIEGIFVAGDARVKSLRQLVTATSDGAIAATEAIKYINKLKDITN